MHGVVWCGGHDGACIVFARARTPGRTSTPTATPAQHPGAIGINFLEPWRLTDRYHLRHHHTPVDLICAEPRHVAGYLAHQATAIVGFDWSARK